MGQDDFKYVYFAGFAGMLALRLYYRWRARENRIVVSRKDLLELLLLAQAAVGMGIIPLIYVFTSRFEFADYEMPQWAGWAGTIVFLFTLFLLWRTHADLGRNWSQTLELRESQRLVTGGVYKYVRHPMYAAFFLWGFVQPLLLSNWIAGWSHLLSFSVLYFLRVGREERMMLDEFGEEYREYMKRTGRVVPRF